MAAIGTHARSSPWRWVGQRITPIATLVMMGVLLLLNVGILAAEVIERTGDLSPLAITAIYAYMVVGFLIPRLTYLRAEPDADRQ